MNLAQAETWAKVRSGGAIFYVENVRLSDNDVKAFELLIDEIERLRSLVTCPVCGGETADVLAMGCSDCMVELVGGLG